MSRNRFTDEFKRDAVAQAVDRGHAVSEVADRLEISTKSLSYSEPHEGVNPKTIEPRR